MKLYLSNEMIAMMQVCVVHVLRSLGTQQISNFFLFWQFQELNWAQTFVSIHTCKNGFVNKAIKTVGCNS